MAVDHTSTPRRTSTRDHFRALELHCEADADEIRTAYFRLVLTNHPDRNPGDADAAVRFKKIQRAYEVLSKRSTLTRAEHLLRTPFKSDSFGVPTPGCEGGAKPVFAFGNSTGRRRNGAVRVGQWLVAATVATALVMMLRGWTRDKSLIATGAVVGSTPFADEPLVWGRREQSDVKQTKVGRSAAVTAAHATRRSETTTAVPGSRTGEPKVVAANEFEKTWKSIVPASLLTLRDTLVMALDEKSPPEAVVGRRLGRQHDRSAADDSRSFLTFPTESDSRASTSGSSQKPDTRNSRGDSTDHFSGLPHARWYAPLGTPGGLAEGDRYRPRYPTNSDYRWKDGSSTRTLEQGYLDRGYLDRGYRDQGGSSRAQDGQSFDPVNDDRLSRPRSSPQRPTHFLNDPSVGFDYTGFDSVAFDSAGLNSTALDATGFDSAGFHSAGFHSTGFHGGMPAKLSNSAAEIRGKIRHQAWSETTPSYEHGTPGTGQLPPLPKSPALPASLTRASIASPSPIGARPAGAVPEVDAPGHLFATTRANPKGQFDGGKSKWGGGLLDKGWRHRPTRDRRASPGHYESADTGRTPDGVRPPINDSSRFSPSHEFWRNPQQVYRSSSPDQKLFNPHVTGQPAVTTRQPAVGGHYWPSQ